MEQEIAVLSLEDRGEERSRGICAPIVGAGGCDERKQARAREGEKG